MNNILNTPPAADTADKQPLFWPHRKTLFLLFAGVTMVGFFTAHGTLSVDPPNRYLVAKSIVDHGDLQMRLIPGEPVPPGTYAGKNGKLYSQFGIGQALIFTGPYYLCRHVFGIRSDKLIRSIISLTVFPLTLGLTALVYFVLLREFDFSARRSYLAALILVFGTGIWQVSKEGQEASHLALLVGLMAYSLRRYQKYGSLKDLTISALATGFAFLTRSDFAPMIICYFIFVFYLIRPNQRKKDSSPSPPARKFFPYAWVIIINAAAWGIHSYLSYQHFGNIIPPHNPFSWKYLPAGLMGLLFSPGRSLFIYNPIFLLVLFGFAAFWRKHRGWALFVTGAFTGCLLLYAAVDCFHGNCCWGPRYLIGPFPLLLLPVAFFGLHPIRLAVSRRIVFLLVVLLSLAVQIAAVSLHHNRELEELTLAYNVGWSDRPWTMFEPQANFLKKRLVNLYYALDDMIHDKIAPWPNPAPDNPTAQQRLRDPVLHYLAFWPYHLTYYLPSIKPSWSVPLWGSTMVLIAGISLGVLLLFNGFPPKPHCPNLRPPDS